MSQRVMITAASMAALTVLAGCQMAGPPRLSSAPRPIVSAQPTSSVDGDWMSTDGVAISRFSGGSFQTIATDTGNKLAEGSYRFRDSRTVEISLTSLIRQTTSNVNCAMVTRGQLNCTNSDGQQFVLVRRA